MSVYLTDAELPVYSKFAVYNSWIHSYWMTVLL